MQPSEVNALERGSKAAPITRQMAWVVLLLLLAKLLGAGKEILLARAYGVGALMDGYQFSLQMASWPVSIFFAICSAALVPAYAALRQQDPHAWQRLRAQVHGATLALALLISAVWLWLCLETPMLGAWGGLSAPAQAYAIQLAVPMTSLIAGGLYCGLLMAECISGQHQASTLLEATPAVVLGGLLLASAVPDAGTLLAGTVGGVLAQTTVLAGYTAIRMRLPVPSARWNHPAWPPLLAALGALLMAQVLQAATGVVDQFWAARTGAGAVSVMGYANRLLFLVLGLGSVAVSRVLLPTLAGLSVAHAGQARQLARRWALSVFGLSALGVLVLWPLAPWLVALLFERGAFGPQDTLRVAYFLQVSWLQVPAALAALVLIQQVLAERRYRVLTVLAAVNLAVKLLGNAVFTPWIGLEGLALSSAAMQLATLLILLLWWRASAHA